MKRLCIIGGGAAGLLVLYNLQRAGVSPNQILLIDPHLCGGDLQEKWYCVRSNTVWRQLLTAVPFSVPLSEPYSTLDPEQPCELRYYIQYLRDHLKEFISKCDTRCTYASKVWHDGQWNIQLQNQGTLLHADLLILTTGSEPKHLDLPFPSIPLCVALNIQRLSDYVKKGDHVLVFGTAHSATIIVNNIITIGGTVTNFYASAKPFYFDRDGDYDGLKQDAAAIADRILAKEVAVNLVSIQDTAAVIRQTKKVDSVIYAIGFETRNPFGLKEYNGITGELLGGPSAWGFGIAYPNKASDGIHWDVSIPAFQAHIEKQMPNILSLLRIE